MIMPSFIAVLQKKYKVGVAADIIEFGNIDSPVNLVQMFVGRGPLNVFGIPLGYGGPWAFFATKEEYKRSIWKN